MPLHPLRPLRAARATAGSVVERAKAESFARALSLPPAQVRRLAGPPVRIDGHELSPYAQLMLRAMRLTFEKGAEEYPVPQGRASMRSQAQMAGGVWPVGQVHERTVRGADGPLPARLYVPRGVTAPGPLLVFFHGGGMVYGDLDSHDALCRFLTEQAGVRVLSVDYRLAPEHPFPAGVDDAFAATEWVVSNAGDYDADPARIAVGGDSAGGYLSAATALRAAREGVPLAFQLLIYPMTEMHSGRASRRTFGTGFYLTKAFMDLSEGLYLAGHDARDPRASVLCDDLDRDVVRALAPAHLVTAGFDPLRDEGVAYAHKLESAGAAVEHVMYPGEIHGFANLLVADTPSRDAMTEIAGVLRAALFPAD